MTRFLLPFCTALLLASTAMAGTVTTTNARGDTITTTHSCSGGTCTTATQTVTAAGKTATRQRVTVVEGTTLTSTLSGTRLNGHSYSRTTTAQR